jgi:N-acetylglucosamine kinase
MSFILGLDSGGTKTIAVIADRDGRIVRWWNGPGFDPMAGDGWIAALTGAADTLTEGMAPAAAVLGLPVHGEVEEVSARQRAVVADVFKCPHLVLNDVEVACDGAFAGDDGVLVLAGTGSMAWAKVSGESARFGGWGNLFGDEGSAYWIGREALSLATQALDGRLDAPGFSEAVVAACGVDPFALIEWAYGQDNQRAGFAALAETVSRLAGLGDATAVALLRTAAKALADHGVAARKKLGRPDLAWSYAGGVFASRTIRDDIARRLGSPVEPKLPPVGGSLLRAAQLAGWPVDADFIHSLAQSLRNKQ